MVVISAAYSLKDEREDAGEEGSQALIQVLWIATGIGGGTFRNFRQEAWV
jgi:hypothetical protein